MRKIFLLLLLAACYSPQNQGFDPLVYVDPFIGTGGHGHTIPGAAVPFGMVQLSPDTHLMGWEASSGYHYGDSVIYGFSHTHLSGTGIGDMGDILFLPFTGERHDSLAATFAKETEKASPGYYAVTLDNFGVLAELTATTRVGVHRYEYPEGEEARLMLDLDHILQANWGHRSVAGELEIVNETTIRGMRKSSGWAYDHPVYFWAEFSEPFALTAVTDGGEPINGKPDRYQSPHLKAYLRFPDLTDHQLLVKVGISGVDEQGAQQNLTQEATHDDFERYQATAEEKWRSQLSILEIKTADPSVLKNFYTSLYHTLFAPMIFQDVDGRYRGMDKKIHQAKAGEMNYTVFSLWDTFRAWHPLITIVDPDRAGMLAQALVQKYVDGGILPKWPLAANYTGTMVGYPAASVIADAVMKDLPGIDLETALEATVFSSGYQPDLIAQLPEPRAKEVSPKHLDFIARMRYVPGDSIAGSVSYGLECAYYDWCIAQLARKAGEPEIEKRFLERAQYYREYFDPVVGFMRGKKANGAWKEPFSPYFADHEFGDYIEGNAWQWSWFVPHDVEGLIELHGGKEAFATKLDSLFTTSSHLEGERASADISGLIGQYAHGNEPSHHIAYFYHWAGQPEKTQRYVDQILKTLYQPTPDGISGNEDCGAMSAWYVLNAMGFYQVAPGNPVYHLGRPMVDEVSIDVGEGRFFRIVVENNAPEHMQVASAHLNGEALEDLTFTHAQLRAGGELKIVMQ
jgi:predicted alpha-1,2-mannosidase